MLRFSLLLNQKSGTAIKPASTTSQPIIDIMTIVSICRGLFCVLSEGSSSAHPPARTNAAAVKTPEEISPSNFFSFIYSSFAKIIHGWSVNNVSLIVNKINYGVGEGEGDPKIQNNALKKVLDSF